MRVWYHQYKNKMIQCLFLFLINFCGAVTVFAENNDPLMMLQTTSGAMIAELRTNKTSLKTNPQVVYGIINRILLPHLDIVGMSRSVLGRQVWSGATQAQQEQFSKEFTRLLVRTYAKAFTAYDDQQLKFLPLREAVGSNTRIQVDSIVLQPDGPKIPVNYRLAKFSNEWKAYDIVIDGVSLLQSYRSQFTAEISQHGLASLIQKLQKQNEMAV